ncbi:MAG: YitT family protein [Clostridia bacterium]|nr:YitT family protein [Clostridia bacterium]
MKIQALGGIETAKKVGFAVLGTLILAFGVAVFIIPFDLVVGGVAGIAVLLHAVFPMLGVDLLITALTWLLFLLGWGLLGKEFAIQTLISSAVYPFGVGLFLKLTEPDVLGGLFCLRESGYPELSLMISAVVGGVLVGLGCAVTFFSGGSTGGVDVIAFAVCKVFRRIKPSSILFAMDALVILLGVFVFGDLVLSLLGIVSALVCAFVIDKVFLGGSAALVAQIVTERWEEINREVILRMDRSTTVWETIGGYSGKPKQMLAVSFSMREYAVLMQIVKAQDPDAFVMVYRAHEIRGEGF